MTWWKWKVSMRCKIPIFENLFNAIFNAIFNFFQVSGKRDLGPVKSQEKLFPDTWDLSSLRKKIFLRLGNWNFFFSMKTLNMHFFPFFFSMKTLNMHFFPFKFDQNTCKISNYWKTTGLRPAIFRGTPGNFNYQVKFGLLENSWPSACYFQGNSWKL